MRRFVAVLSTAAVLGIGGASVSQATFAGAENGRIFYVVGAYTTYSTILSACPANGGHVKTVVNLATWPMPSPDGTKIAYVKLKQVGNTAYNDGVWIANADGSNAEQIAGSTYSPSAPAWSPDGTKLTFRRYVVYPAPNYSRMQPVVADIATKVVTPLLTDGTITANTEQVTPNAWTADGSQIYFPAHPASQSSDDLYRVPAGGGTATRIMGTDDELPFFQRIDIAPDNSAMLVAQQVSYYEADNVTFNPLSETRRVGLGGGSGPLIGSIRMSTGVGDEGFAYSPDGTRVVFLRSPGEKLMTAEAGGANAIALGGLGGAYPAWSSNLDDCTDPGAATMRINEVGLGDAHFVELLDPADETFPSAQGPYRLVVYDGAGAKTGAHTISSALLQARDNTKPLLLSTPAANAAYGVTGDETLSVALPSPGQACFTKGAGEQKVDCVAWGCIATPVSAGTTRIPAPAAAQSAQRQGIGSTVFQLTAPTPKAANAAGTGADPCGPAPSGPGAGAGSPDPGASPGGSSAGAGSPPAAAPLLRIKGGSVLTLKGNAVPVTVACAAGTACTGRATLTVTQASGPRHAARQVTIGAAAVRIAGGKTATIKVVLNATGRRLLKKKRARVKARLTVALTGGAPVARTLTVRR